MALLALFRSDAFFLKTSKASIVHRQFPPPLCFEVTNGPKPTFTPCAAKVHFEALPAVRRKRVMPGLAGAAFGNSGGEQPFAACETNDNPLIHQRKRRHRHPAF